MAAKPKRLKPADEENDAPAEPRKTKQVVEVEDFQDDPIDVDAQNKLSEFLEMFGDREYKIRVEKQNPENNEWEICDRVMLNGFDQFDLAKKFGGGKYRCSLLDDSGKFVAGGRMRFTFAKQPSVAPSTVVPTGMNDPVVQMMIENGKQQTAMLMEILKVSLTGHAPTGAAPSLNDVIQSVKSIHDLSPKTKDADAASQLEKMLDLQIKIQKLTGGGGSDADEGGGTGLGALLGELKEAFSMVTKMKGLPAPAARPVIAGQPQIARPPVKNPSEVLNSMPIYEQKIMSYVPVFVEAAAKNGDAEKWAPFLLNLLDTQIVPALVDHYKGFASEDIIWEKLIDAANDPETFESIFAKAPALAPYRDWVRKVIDAALVIEGGAEELVTHNADVGNVPIPIDNGVIPVPVNGSGEPADTQPGA